MGSILPRLTETVPEHIRADGDTLCGADCDGADARVVPDDRDPLADASVHLCTDCADEWARIEDETERAETVRCVVDRLEDREAWKCGRVVAATDARRLKHPDVDGDVPACRDCYTWIRDRPTTSVTTPYDEAAPWGET